MSIDKLKKRKTNPWRARVYDRVQRKRVSRCFAFESEAKQWERQILAAQDLSKPIHLRDIVFNDLVSMFLKHAKNAMSFAGNQRYEGAIRKYILPYFENRKLTEIRRFDIESFLGTLKNKRSASTIFTIMKTLFNKAVAWELIPTSPAQNVKAPSKNPSVENHWEEGEIHRFLFSMKDSPRIPLYLLALNTGMRSGELFGLKWDCVDFQRNWIHVKRSYCQKTKIIRETTKTKTFRRIPMNLSLRKLLAELKLASKDTRVFDPELLSMDPTHTSKRVSKDCKVAGVKVIRFHDLRHTMASQFMARGGNIFELSKILGHTDIQMTQRYLHFAPEYGQKIAEIVSLEVPKAAPLIPIGGHTLVTLSENRLLLSN
jgi:integrase